MTQFAKTREDLLYHPDPHDDDVVLVKDPIRRQYFRYNALQVAMMRALDGQRGFEEVQAQLEREFDVEEPIESISRFLARIETS